MIHGYQALRWLFFPLPIIFECSPLWFGRRLGLESDRAPRRWDFKNGGYLAAPGHDGRGCLVVASAAPCRLSRSSNDFYMIRLELKRTITIFRYTHILPRWCFFNPVNYMLVIWVPQPQIGVNIETVKTTQSPNITQRFWMVVWGQMELPSQASN